MKLRHTLSYETSKAKWLAHRESGLSPDAEPVPTPVPLSAVNAKQPQPAVNPMPQEVDEVTSSSSDLDELNDSGASDGFFTAPSSLTSTPVPLDPNSDGGGDCAI